MSMSVRKAGELLHRLSVHAAKCFPPPAGTVRDVAKAAALTQLKGVDPAASGTCSETARLLTASTLVRCPCSGLVRKQKVVQLGVA